MLAFVDENKTKTNKIVTCDALIDRVVNPAGVAVGVPPSVFPIFPMLELEKKRPLLNAVRLLMEEVRSYLCHNANITLITMPHCRPRNSP